MSELTQEKIKQFKAEGYCIVKNFFNERETQAIQAEVERLKRIGKLHNVATEGDGKTASTQKKNLQLCPAFQDSPLFRSLPFHPKVVSAVQTLIGDVVVLHLDQIFLKPAKDGAGTNWHQDNAYFRITDPMKGTALWIAAHDATIANGTMRIIPNAFKEPLPHSRDPMSNHHIRCYPDESKAIDCEIPAGSVVFFCYGTPHATGGNSTTKDRAGVAFHFLTQDSIDSCGERDRFYTEKDYHPILTGPNATGGLKEYGIKIAGTWENEINQLLATPANA